MMKKSVKKILISSLLISLTMISNVSNIYANKIIQSDNSGDDSGGSSTPIEPVTVTQGTADGYEATCSYTTSVYVWSDVYANIYDSDGNKIENIDDIKGSLEEQELSPILAGRHIGLNVYEEKGYTVSVDYSVEVKKTVHTCYYCNDYCTPSEATPVSFNFMNKKNNIQKLRVEIPLPFPEDDNDDDTGCVLWSCQGSYVNTTVSTEEDCTNLGGTVTNTSSTTRDPTSEEMAWCKQLATPSLPSLTPSYEVTYKDSNDINAEETDSNYGGITHTGSACNATDPSIPDGTTYSVSKTCTFQYNRGNACINATTGKISYIGAKITCDSNDEYLLPTDGNIWKYFIPLNTKSGQGFSFTMDSSTNKQDSGLCQNIIDENDNYKNRITDSTGTPFLESDTKSTAKTKVVDGCYYRTHVIIPVEQKFYNEVEEDEDSTKFYGFNFYYKPIDINNPFPNGIGTISLWKEWYDAVENDEAASPNLSNSFSNVTYVAQNISASKIRTYNTSNPYTNWSESMNKNGKSDFIDNEGIITRINEPSFYNLGCGPANEDWSDCS